MLLLWCFLLVLLLSVSICSEDRGGCTRVMRSGATHSFHPPPPVLLCGSLKEVCSQRKRYQVYKKGRLHRRVRGFSVFFVGGMEWRRKGERDGHRKQKVWGGGGHEMAQQPPFSFSCWSCCCRASSCAFCCAFAFSSSWAPFAFSSSISSSRFFRSSEYFSSMSSFSR